MPAEECVKVVVRCRPLNDKERSSGRTNIVEVDADGREVVLLPSPDDPATSRRSFTFDKVVCLWVCDGNICCAVCVCERELNKVHSATCSA